LAWRYSVRERINSTYDDLDGALCFPRPSPTDETIKRAAAKAGIIRLPTREDFIGYEKAFPNFDRRAPTWIERSMDIPIDRAMEIKIFGEQIQIKHTEILSAKLKELYALWLRIFAQSPGWDALNMKKKIMLAQRLFREVADYGSVEEVKRSKSWTPSQTLVSESGLNIGLSPIVLDWSHS
jgi:hypothetical protein